MAAPPPQAGATPSGQSAVNTPPGRAPNQQEQAIIDAGEVVRINLLSKALPLVMDLLTKITMGDPSAADMHAALEVHG